MNYFNRWRKLFSNGIGSVKNGSQQDPPKTTLSFKDERVIYRCNVRNVCRVGKGNPETNRVIICLHCHKEIPLTEALSHQMKKDLRKEFDVEFRKKERV